MYIRHIKKVCMYMCDRGREIEREWGEYMCVRDRENVCKYVIERKCVCMCVIEEVRERVCVCVSARSRACVCVIINISHYNHLCRHYVNLS